MAQQEITPAQRMAYFNQSTRQNFHMMPTETGGASQTIQMQLPKARLLSKIILKVEAKVNAKHATKGSVKVNPHGLIRRISLDLNNGFSPYTVTGYQAHLLNMLTVRAHAMEWLSPEEKNLIASASGTENDISLIYELPVCMNERDTPQGLILLQNAETNVTLSVDTGTGGDIILPTEDKTGFTTELVSVKIKAFTETFSIPAVQEAFPDLSILLLKNGVNHSFMGNGENTVKLATGTIYRKLILIFEDENGLPLRPEDFTGPISLVFNQADINYNISADMLFAYNTMMLNWDMPDGVYYFDFSTQGFPNFGGSRDMIDTELLTSFELKFSTTKKGKVQVVSECVARVR